ncbi:SusC/RagA family TonB-linked outer membrane protein [Bacteroidales bacterium OttesenSCG-928-M11]|nr:SusC/RagA family TonB-linked outer membrane protein [Bacteroidales bacterium OttesenSCG-928-M11]
MKNKIIYILLIGCMLCCQSIFAQEGSGDMIRGRVTSELGEGLIAATVLEMDRNDRIVGQSFTDMNGDFSMRIGNNQNKLKISYIGYVTQVFTIGTKRSFSVVLKDENMMEAVVVTAVKKTSDGTLNIPDREISFAMQKINTEVFDGVQVSSIDDALQGQIAGLDIIGGGDLGKGTQMRIRGVNSLSSNSNPLIVMNGVPREDISTENFDFSTADEQQYADLLSVNPDDILEITVLKDAASTAVWGARGANGVLMISTKKGAKGPTRVNYTYKLTTKVQPKGLKMLNGDDYTMLMKQAYFNPQQSNTASNIPEFNYDPNFSEYEYYNNNTDWRDEVIQTGFTHDHYLSLSGGGDKANFRVAGGYMSNTGTIIGQSWQRFTSRVDLSYYVSNRIKFDAEFAFTYQDNNRNWTDDRSEDNYNNGKSILDIAYKKMPNLAIYNKDANGNDLDSYYNIRQDAHVDASQVALRNPVALAELADNTLKTYNIQPILRLQYDLMDPAKHELKYNVWVSFDMKNEMIHKFLPKEVSSRSWSHEDINRSDDEDKESFGIQSENKLTFVPKFSNTDHSLSILASLQTSSGNSNNQRAISYGFPSSHMSDASGTANLKSVQSGIGQWRSLGMIGRMHYAYKSKYIFGFTFRRDGSTKFGKGNKYGNFPGVSLRWNIADESFMSFAKDWLNILAIRPSWGIAGNSPGSEYLHYSKYSPYSSYAGQTTIRPGNIRLSNLKWEKTTEYNLGLDLALFDNKYTLDANVYSRRTEDLLFQNQAIPTSSGFSSLAYRNGGTMDNIGWELNANANRFAKIGNVVLDFRFNLANSVNKLVTLNEDILNSYNEDFSYENGKYLGRLQEGKAYGSIYGFRYLGVYRFSAENYEKGTAPVARNEKGEVIFDNKGNPVPMYYNFGENGTNYQFQAGDAMYEDINHDGNIDELDIVYLGNSNPELTGGFGFTARWNRFTLNAQANFRYGNKIINSARMNAENMYTDDNQSIAVNWRWRKEGDDTEMPRALYKSGYNWLASDRFVEDGSFLKLKYLSLNYAFPSEKIKEYGLKQLSLYVTANNLFCLTKYQGVDPEIGNDKWGVSKDTSTTPRAREFTFGIQVGF